MVRHAGMLRLAVIAVVLPIGLRAAPAAPADCDAICRLQAYLATDHMVVMAPVPPSDAIPSRHPRIVARRAPKHSAVAARRPAARHPMVVAARHSEPARADKVRIATSPMPAVASPDTIAAPAKPAPAVGAWPEHPLIPGSAPLIAAQLVPPAAR